MSTLRLFTLPRHGVWTLQRACYGVGNVRPLDDGVPGERRSSDGEHGKVGQPAMKSEAVSRNITETLKNHPVEAGRSAPVRDIKPGHSTSRKE